jgi:hypothetical protein
LTKFHFFGTTRFQHFLFLDQKNQNAMKKMLTIMSNIYFMAFCRIFSLCVAKSRNVCFLGRFTADVAVFAETTQRWTLVTHATLSEAASSSRGQSMVGDAASLREAAPRGQSMHM